MAGADSSGPGGTGSPASKRQSLVAPGVSLLTPRRDDHEEENIRAYVERIQRELMDQVNEVKHTMDTTLQTVTATVAQTCTNVGNQINQEIDNLAARVSPLEEQMSAHRSKMGSMESELARLRSHFAEELGIVRATVPEPVIRAGPA
ncbi:unnamed protein product [Prorocentrum cordatum]|uniref:Biogenesis of lysosome-related organelles complex 1 subunit 7 n=1 Tax=Prorocentrum cordatum TaxID=2364126 RepID=A0ABN9X700_9DINO|nr:unnamed protein product [Polarella glacialis]